MQHDHTAAADWLALFITACDDDTGEGMTEQQLRDEVITFIFRSRPHPGFELDVVSVGFLPRGG